MRALAFTGMPGSGKSEAVAAAQRRGIPVLRMGDLVFEATREQGLPVEEAGRVAREQRERDGPDVWARRTVARLASGTYGKAPLVVIDGVRSLDEVERFRKDLGRTFCLVAVTAPEGIRHDRLAVRGRGDATEDARARDEREKGWGIQKAIAAADVTVANESSVEELRARIEALLDREIAAGKK